jgi:hypothetical protein
MSDVGDDYTDELVMFETKASKMKSDVEEGFAEQLDVPGLLRKIVF